MNRVLVTGASGFIGKSLIPALLDLGIETVALVRSASRLPDSIVKSVEVVEGDIRDPTAMRTAVRGVDGIFHLAAATGAFSLKHYRSVNVEGVKSLADAVLALPNPPKLVHVSSLAAAGPSSEEGVTEQDACRPVSYYGRTKLEAENYLRGISPQIPITILRPPCVFGPGDRNLLLFFQSVKRGLNFCAISMKNRYSFLEVHDLIDGMLAAMRRGKPIRTFRRSYERRHLLSGQSPAGDVPQAGGVVGTVLRESVGAKRGSAVRSVLDGGRRVGSLGTHDGPAPVFEFRQNPGSPGRFLGLPGGTSGPGTRGRIERDSRTTTSSDL